MTFIQEEQEVLSTENGIFDKDEPTEDDIDFDDSDSEPFEPRTREEGVDSNLDEEESWFGRRARGSNKNPTRGVMGTFAGSKGTQAGPKGTQAGPKGTQAGPKGTQAGGPKGCTKAGSKGIQADPKSVKK